MDSLYPPIQSLYRDFSKFFIDKLGIPRELPTAKWVEALTSLDTVENSEERKAEALAIYRRANRDLGPKFGREVQAPDWVDTFQTEAVYIDQRGEIVPNDEYLFANDDDAIAALFVDEDDLSFLAVPSQEVPRFSRLLELAEVSRLSESITREVSNADSGIVDEDLTKRVHHSVQFFARVLYAKRPDVFEQALDGRFASLRDLEVARVPQVDILVSIGDYSRETTADIALSESRVLYRDGARSVKDMLAAELSKFLGVSTDLADTFARILMESETDSIEDFLRVRNIGALPSDLLEALYNSAAPSDEDGTDGTSMEQPEGEQEPTLDEASAATEREVERGLSGSERPKDGGLATSPTRADTPSGGSSVLGTAPGSQGMPSQETGEGQANAPSHTPRTSAHQPRGGSTTPPNAPTSRTSLSAEGGQGHSEAGGTQGAAQSGEASSQGSGLPLQASSGGSSKGPSDSVGSHQPSKGFSPGQSRRGRSQAHKTKVGRLLSYAVGPGEVDQPNSADDPEKAAAREATGRAAVEYFITTQAGRWKSLTPMPHNNPGFDVHAIAHDDQEEFIEVKGQSGAWTEEGVALTPKELMTAQQKGDRYWLCVVEYAQDNRRQLHLLRNPYGLTQQFRFDVGWKSAAQSFETVPLKPEQGMYIDISGIGTGQILSVRDKGRFFQVHVILDDGRQVHKLFNPATMNLSKEPTWQE